MSDFSTIILVPFLIAFLTFMLRFYSREHAASKLNLSFLLGVFTSLTAGVYLLLRISDRLPPHSTLIWGLAGVVLCAIAITRMIRL